MTTPTWFGGILRDRARAALATQTGIGGALAGVTVLEDELATDVPDSALPAILLYTPVETKELLSTTGSDPQFRATLSLQVRVRSRGTDITAVAQGRDQLIYAVQETLLCHAFLRQSPIEQVKSANIYAGVDGKSRQHIGEADLIIEFQYTDTYRLNFATMNGAVASGGTYTGADLSLDAIVPFDPNGAYSTAYPAPRTSGPDGRVEVAFTADPPT